MIRKALILSVLSLTALVSPAKDGGGELHDLLLSSLALEETHPDSLESNIARLKQRRLESADAAEQAVYAAALGRLYAERVQWRSVGTDLRDSSLYWYGQALADKQLLAQTKAKKWKPFVIIGKDEGYFGGDMLNVVWRSMVGSLQKSVRDTCQALPKYGEMVDFYRSRGLREGALLLALDSLYEKSGEVTDADLLKLRDEYADLPLCAEVYLRLGTEGDKTPQERREWLSQGIGKYPKYKRKAALQNALTRLSDPMLQWAGPSETYPGRQYVWRFTVRNVQSVLINGEEHKFPEHDLIETFQDSIVWTAPAPGLHKFEFVPKTSAKLTGDLEHLTQTVKVSRLLLVHQEMPDSRVRFLIVDAMTGKPQPGVTVKACDPQTGPTDNDFIIEDATTYFIGKTDAKGQVLVPRMKKNGRSLPQLRYQFSRDDEDPRLHSGMIYAYNTNQWVGARKDSTRVVNLYTDRNIYRPGQTVHVGGFVYDQLDWEGAVRKGLSYTVELLNASYKVVEQKTISTDEMGTFSADFVLPEGEKNGYYQVRVNSGARVGFRVEEYKRPTFEVTLCDSVRTVGDSVVVTGIAKTYEGSPLRGARVTGRYQWRRPWLYALPGKRMPNFETLPLDTIQTDGDGRFEYTLHRPEQNLSLDVNVDVLSAHGESHNTQHTYWRHLLIPNPQPQKVDSTFLVRCVPDTFDVGRPARVEVTTNLSEVWLHYTLAAAGKIWQDSVIVLSNETRVFDIPYRTDYDQSATISFCFAKNERVYTATKYIYLAQPDKKLRMHWETFRDLLQPGQKEEWKLTLLNPDGTPAKANAMMAMYDASLDYFGTHQWYFDFYRGYRTYGVQFQGGGHNTTPFNVSKFYNQRTKKESDISLTRIDPELFQVKAYTRTMGRGPIMYKAAARNTAVLAAAPMTTMAMVDGAAEEQSVATEVKAAGSVVAEEDVSETVETITMPMRENFDETAFFYPQLRTNKNGQVTISFTLPESLTRWNLLGLAHTADLNYLRFDEQIEARKDLMAQLYLPRFLRPGDHALLSAAVRNVSGEAQNGRATLQVLDARTEKVLRTWRADIRLAVDADTTLTFGYVSPDQDVIVRVAVEGTTCTDGEQRLLPVLPATMHVTNTIAITAFDPSVQNIDLSDIFPEGVTDQRLTVEYTTHPEQYALKALPALAQAKCNDLLSLAAAYYGGMLGKALGVEMADSTEVYLSRIQELQGSDGAFSWYPQMHSSPYLTREVSYLLTRLRMLTGQSPLVSQNARLNQINERAVHYLLGQRIDSTYLSVADLRTLYIALYSCVRLSKEEQKKVDFLTKLAKREDVEEEGYERQALLAIVLKEAGADRKARKCAEAFRQYIVTNPKRGSYIEFPKGSFASVDRKLHIHVQLMEALQRMNPEDTLLIGMRRYLLQQKRTQEWSTPVNSANAIYALLADHGGAKAETLGRQAKDLLTLTRQGTAVQNFTPKDDALGYLRDSVEIEDGKLPVRLRLHKLGKGESWGSVYADFEQPFDQVEARSEGLSVRAEYPKEMKRGNRYKIRYYLSADRDYEYVTMILPRPAATEPVNPLSGYRWNTGSTLGWSGGLGFYRQVHDAATELNFCEIPRGDYLIEEDIYVERDGSYHTGVSIIRCDYAEEFQGHSEDSVITIR